MSIDLIREQIKKLKTEREKASLEKGLAAEENKDLRENFAYDYWVEKEAALTAKIGSLLKEIKRLTTKKTEKAVHPKKKKSIGAKPVTKIKDLPKNRWL